MRHTNFITGVSAPDWAPVTRRLGLDTLFQEFADGAAERDGARRPIFGETAELKRRGYVAVRLNGASLPELFALTRDLATADPNIAHVFRNHFFAVEQHLKTEGDSFSDHVLDLARDNRMFGVAFSEQSTSAAGGRDQIPGAVLEPDGDGFRVSGTKIYSTGNIYADRLFATAVDPAGAVRQFFIPTTAPGVVLEDDWDGFGQKLTGSGKTVFDRVAIGQGDLFELPQADPDAPYLYHYTFHQIYLTTVITGIVNRVLLDAVNLVRGRSRNFYHALAERPADEPELQAVIGRISGYRAALLAVTDRAIEALDLAWRHAATPDAQRLSVAASIAAAEAKVVVDETAPHLASLLIDVSSGSGVSASRALDRHWRNIKVIAAHNPRIYKERIIGDHYLNGALPPTGAFF